jgi:hypothetical protein
MGLDSFRRLVYTMIKDSDHSIDVIEADMAMTVAILNGGFSSRREHGLLLAVN